MSDRGPIRVLLVDDHAVVRSGLGAVISAYDGLDLVGEAGDGDEAVRLCQSLKPDVVLMDLLMPKMDGVAATRAIKEQRPETRIIALTSFKEKDYVEGALKAGATSYLLKNVSAQELVSAIRKVVSGQSSLSPEAAEVLIQGVKAPQPPGFDMTAREKEILALMVDGLTNEQISEKLIVSLSTVKFHISNVLSKLGVNSRTEAVALALRNKLVK
jgi:NarL family two-component system response regulator LiaR